jgi:WD40 repeat protein
VTRVAAGLQNSKLLIYNTDLQASEKLSVHQSAVTSIDLGSKGLLASGDSAGKLFFTDIDKLRSFSLLGVGQSSPFVAVRFWPRTNHILAGGQLGKVLIYDIRQYKATQ